LVSLVDADNTPIPDGIRQLGLDLLCTNRDLPMSMPVRKQHTDFTVTVNAPIAAIRCLVGPTTPRPSPDDGDLAWRFISHLGLNYLSLTDAGAAEGAAALRGLLRLYLPPNNMRTARQLDGLLSVEAEPIVQRLPGPGPICAGRGLQVRLSIDDTAFGGAGGILLAAVLDRFFAKYVSINAFTQTVMTSPDRGQVMRWPLRLGRRAVL
jgi:type VI secretion system protein ImpG